MSELDLSMDDNLNIKPKPILAAAIKTEATIYTLPRPYRHEDIRSRMNTCVENGGWGDTTDFEKMIAGFITENGQFVTRWQALRIARHYNQILPNTKVGNELYTYNLW